MLSPLLFNLFINDFATYLKSLDLGVKVGDETLCIMLYGDDIVFLAECETDLQLYLNTLYDWCGQNEMTVNLAKSNVVHFRQNSISKTEMAWKPTSVRYVSGKVYICTGQNFQQWMIVRF